MYQKMKELKSNRKQSSQSIKDEEGILSQEKEIRARWAQCVEELYQKNCEHVEGLQCQQHKNTITEEEVQSIVKQLTKNTASGVDNIPAEFMQNLGDKGMQVYKDECYLS
jgi:Glu-tRNA(Gln) amidotransferase subunit E-like FAD-binding protein